jgi:anti-sigma factor RsiW
MDELEQITTRYLLGELSEPEQIALEEKFFTDPQVFNQVLQAESKLVDAYARGQLSNEMRERFEQSYLQHPARRERAKFASALTTRLDRDPESVMPGKPSPTLASRWQRLLSSLRGRRPTLRFAIALATLLIMLAGGWIFVGIRRQQQREAAQMQTARENEEQQAREREAARQQPATSAPPTEKPPAETASSAPSSPQPAPQSSPNPTVSPAPPVVFLALKVGGVRGGDNGRTPILVIPQGTTQARLLLPLKDNSYSRYRLSLEKIGGTEIFRQTDVKPRSTKSGARFVFTVPARRFANGDYALTVSGINPDGGADDLSKSLFRVEKR